MATPRPRVHIVATGGSISGLGPHRLDYILYPELGQRLSIEELLARIPEAQEVAHIEEECSMMIQISSSMVVPPRDAGAPLGTSLGKGAARSSGTSA